MGKKSLIIGLDGVPYSLLKTYLEEGLLPNMQEILSQGFHLMQTRASIPDVSSVSWTSFTTGVNPGEHGIYGFSDLKPYTYSLYFPHSLDVRAPRWWEILGGTCRGKESSLSHEFSSFKQAYTSIILNVPHTYPAYPMKGILVAGFVAIDLEKAVYPPDFADYFREKGYMIDVDSQKAHHNREEFLEDLFLCLKVRKEVFGEIFQNQDWDIFFACITETDRLHHFFFPSALDKDDPYHEIFLKFYKEVDAFVGELTRKFWEKFGKDSFLMILSDHGFTSLKKDVFINRYLEEGGFLKLLKEGEFYEKISPSSIAFAMDPGRIYIHSKRRYPQGRIGEKEIEGVKSELKGYLKELKDEEGETVLKKILEKEEIYKGPCLSEAPDLVCLPQDGYNLRGRLESERVFEESVFKGMHTWHDAFCILREELTPSQGTSIENLAELILKYFSSP